jgi:cell wall-associated NlpC family hydrolase
MRRVPSLLALLAIACALATPAPAARPDDHGPTPRPVWDPQEIATVVSSGLLGPSVDEFRPDDPLTWGELADALSAWGRPIPAPANPDKPVAIRELDARLVVALGLQPASKAIRVAARDAGLNPNPSLGTETVARLLGLRLNHPAGQDTLELLPTQAATRAETAYSLAQAMNVSDWQKQQVASAAATFALPQVTDWQRRVLTRALRFVGYPYVWTGTSEKASQTLWDGTVVPGGFDCSGFVWRVYKLQPYPGAPALSEILQGRTTYAMSGEVPAALRIPIADLQSGDVVFFGTRGPQSKPTEVGHMGIYVGGGWFVHSSGHGVTLDQMTGWYRTRFAWARRPLAEAGLEDAQTGDTAVAPTQ